MEEALLEHKHVLSYEISKSEVEGVLPRKVELSFDGNVNLDEIIEHFSQYLTAVGYVLPDNTYLGLVSK